MKRNIIREGEYLTQFKACTNKVEGALHTKGCYDHQASHTLTHLVETISPLSLIV